MLIHLYYAQNADIQPILTIAKLIELPLKTQPLDKSMRQKSLETLTENSLFLDKNNQLHLLVDGMKVALNWQGQQQRVVKAGKKTELLLKACKLQPNMQVIDTTAGFGHDSLILASTGANVIMIEENPIMYLLLCHEIQQMQQRTNWQKLIARLKLYFANAQTLLPTLEQADVIYLDPMFPQDSYKTAQVGKHMQVLHRIADIPDIHQEMMLLNIAINQIKKGGRVIVKRPNSASFLANHTTSEQWLGETIRFDGYFKI